MIIIYGSDIAGNIGVSTIVWFTIEISEITTITTSPSSVTTTTTKTTSIPTESTTTSKKGSYTDILSVITILSSVSLVTQRYRKRKSRS